jgi:TolB-like protein/Flp pilus assembly protein TadD
MKLAAWSKRIFQDLRRRRVFKVAAAYLAVVFVLLQVAEIVLPALGQDRGLTIAVVAAIVGFPVTVVLAWLYDLSPLGVVRTPPMDTADGDDASATDATSGPRLRSTSDPAERRRTVAVLPFEQVGGDSEDRYFADGIHEDVLTSLSKVADLHVLSRSAVLRYGSSAVDLHRLAHELGAGAVLEGSVRRAGGNVRITARLVDADTEQNVWAETYDRALEDIFRIQQDVALHIVRALEAELSAEEHARIAAQPTRDLEAYDLYLRGRHLWNERTERSLEAAVVPLEKATRLDPGFALAHAGLADAHLTRALYALRAPDDVMPLALWAADRALELDPTLGEARAARGCVQALYRWHWTDALSELEAASRAHPGYATAHQWRAVHVLAPLGRFAEAHDAVGRALHLDAASPAVHATAAFLLYLERRFDEAEAACRKLVRDTPSFAMGHLFLGQTLHQKGEHAAALTAVERAGELRGHSAELRIARALPLAALGRTDEVVGLRSEVDALASTSYVSPSRIARLDLAAGDEAAALDRVEAAVAGRATDLAWARTDPELDPLRTADRFQACLALMGLAEVGAGAEG